MCGYVVYQLTFYLIYLGKVEIWFIFKIKIKMTMKEISNNLKNELITLNGKHLLKISNYQVCFFFFKNKHVFSLLVLMYKHKKFRIILGFYHCTYSIKNN